MADILENGRRLWLKGLFGLCLFAISVFSSAAHAEGCCDVIPVKVTLANGTTKSGFFLAYVCGIYGTNITKTASAKTDSTDKSQGLDISFLTQSTVNNHSIPYLAIGHKSFVWMKYSLQKLIMKDKDGTIWNVKNPQCSFKFYFKLPDVNRFETADEYIFLKIPDFKIIVRTGNTIEENEDD
jgi:hypothetical protein